MEYIKIPSVDSVEIDGLSIYKDNTFQHDFESNLNLFLGVNGLGKTTTLRVITFGLVGVVDVSDIVSSNYERKELVELESVAITKKNYFRSFSGVNKTSNVKIQFSIGDDKVTITRSLYNTKIKELLVGGKEIIVDDIEGEYRKIFHNKSGMEINDYIILLYTLMVRMEEAPSLLFRPRAQNAAIRNLFVEYDFHRNFEEAESNLRKSDVQLRHEINDLRNWARKEIADEIQKVTELEKRIKDLKKNDEGSIELEKKQIKRDELNNLLLDLQLKNESIEKQLVELDAQIVKRKAELVKCENETSGFQERIEKLNNEIGELRKVFFNSVYSNANSTNKMAINAISERNTCVFCDCQISEQLKEELLDKISKGTCLFCNSIDEKHLHNKPKSIDMDELNRKYSEKKSLLNENSAVIRDKKQIKAFVEELTEKSNKLNEVYLANIKKVEEANYNLNNIKREEAKLINESESNVSVLYTELTNRKEILGIKLKEFATNCEKIFGEVFNVDDFLKATAGDLIDKAIGGTAKEKRQALAKYQKLTEKLKIKVENIEKDVTKKFEKYNALKDDFGIRVHQSNKLEKNIPVYYPVFVPYSLRHGDIRTEQNTLSKSEQILLDFAFRLAMMDLYTEKSKNSVRVAIETSEGVLDVGYLKKYAEMLKEYHKNHSMIAITNLNNDKFIKNVIGDNDSKVVNFIQKSSKIIEDYEPYEAFWKLVFNERLER